MFLVLIYPFTVRWGLLGAGWAVTTVYIVSFVLNAFMTGFVIEKFFKILIKASLIPVAATFALAMVTILIQIELKGLVAPFRFSVAGISGVTVFSAIILILNRRMILDLIQGGLEK